MGIHRRGHAFPDAGEGNTSRPECVHGDFVSRIVDGGQRAAREPGAAGEIERGEIRRPWRFKFQLRQCGEIQRAQAASNTARPGERVLDRETHVRPAELREHRDR